MGVIGMMEPEEKVIRSGLNGFIHLSHLGRILPEEPIPFDTVRSIPIESPSARVHWPHPLLSCEAGLGPT